MFELLIGEYKLTSLEDFQQIPSDLSSLEIEAFQFCKSWLQGQESFSLQTSGSTGTPKNIIVGRNQMLSSAMATQSFFGISSGTLMLCCMNTNYIAGKMMLVRAMVWKCPILIVEPTSKPFDSVPSSFFPEFVAMVPLQVELSIVSHLAELKAIKYLLIGGAPLSENLQEQIFLSGLKAFQSYGMTETVSHIAIAPISQNKLQYQGLPGVEIGTDERGALWVKAEMSNGKRIQTNDLVEMITPTSFIWVGRADFVINSGGIKLHPEILETKIGNTLHRFFPLCSFFFFGEADEKLGQKLVLYIESENQLEEKASLLQEAIKPVLSKFERPKEIYIIPKFARTQTGKINRQKTLELK
jgi:O-succinylbenzoic acid--CoA ligase